MIGRGWGWGRWMDDWDVIRLPFPSIKWPHCWISEVIEIYLPRIFFVVAAEPTGFELKWNGTGTGLIAFIGCIGI